MSESEIFDRAMRRLRRDRAARLGPQHPIFEAVCDDLLDRLGGVQHDFKTALVWNGAAGALVSSLQARGMTVSSADPGADYARINIGLQGDEDVPLFPEGGFDLILSVGLLDTVNDVPGALALMRRVLAPNGLMLCAFVGAGSMDGLRDALRTIDPAVQRVHPMIDVRAGGDLLARAGFKLPVADADSYPLRYDALHELLHDIRALAATNMLRERRAMSKAKLRALEAYFPLEDQVSVITLTGWSSL